MGKWISFSLTPKVAAEPLPHGWETIYRRVPAVETAILYQRISEWLSKNRTHSTKCFRMHGEEYFEIGRISDTRVEFGDTSTFIRVKFRSVRDAVLFKMYFSEYIFTPDYSVRKPLRFKIVRNLVWNKKYQTVVADIAFFEKKLVAMMEIALITAK